MNDKFEKSETLAKIFLKVFFIFILLTGCILPSMKAHATSFVTVYPSISNISSIPVTNPGKGWLSYFGAGDQDYNQYSQNALDCSSTAYTRFDWGQLEKDAKDSFNWAIIDDQINKVKAKGKKLAFRVMALNVHSKSEYSFPQWVVDGSPTEFDKVWVNLANEGGVDGYKYYPKNPGGSTYWKTQVQHLVTALANRYNNNPDVAFIDVGTIGTWGEQLSYGLPNQDLSEADWKTHVGWYKNAFTNKLLLNCKNNGWYDWADTQGFGRRSDGFLVPTENEARYGSGIYNSYIYRIPSVLEYNSGAQYSAMYNNFNWGVFWDGIMDVGKPSYVGWYWLPDGSTMYNDYPERTIEAGNRMGYHFVMQQMTYPDNLANGSNGAISIQWRNDGCRYADYPIYIACALMDSNNNVLQRVWLDNIDLKTNCQPWVTYDKDTSYSGAFNLSSPVLYNSSDSISFSSNSSGTRIAIGAYTSKSLTNPDISLGNEGKTENGWYPLNQYSQLPQTDLYPSLHNLAYKNPVTASTTSDPSLYPGLATDGNATTRWSSSNSDNEWIYVDLGTPKNFSKIRLNWESAYGKQYKIQVSNDTANWMDVFTETNGNGGLDYISLANTTARYVRMFGLQRGTQNGYSLYEFEVLGSDYPKDNKINLLSNSGFERGTEAWYGSTISEETSIVRSGSRACKSSNRKNCWEGPVQDIQQALLANGQGSYEVSGWVKLASGTDTVRVTVKIVDSAGTHYTHSEVSAGTGWIQADGIHNITWAGTLQSAELYVQTVGYLSNMYVDDVVMTRMVTDQILKNNSFEHGIANWYGSTISEETSIVHSGSRACKSSSRQNCWEGPVQDIQQALLVRGQGSYEVSGWVKLASGTDTVRVTVKIVDSAGTHYTHSEVSAGTGWIQADGIHNITWTGTLQSAELYVQTVGYLSDMYVDDVVMTKMVTGQVLKNSGFEHGIANWYGGTISEETSVIHLGSRACKASGRQNNWEGPIQDIQEALLTNGQGNYEVGGWVKLASGTDTVQVTVKITDSSGTHYAYTSVPAGTGWSQADGILNIAWIGTLQSAVLYVQTGGTLSDMYVDDVVMTKV